jgi:hypothetical protein
MNNSNNRQFRYFKPLLFILPTVVGNDCSQLARIYNPCTQQYAKKHPKILAIYEKDTKYQFSYLKPKKWI